MAKSRTGKKAIADSLAQAEAVTEALGEVFARSLAAYTVEVLRLMQDRGLTAVDRERRAQPGVDEQEALERAPIWVRQAYERSRRPSRSRLTSEPQIRGRVIRNRLGVALKQQGMSQKDLAKRLGKSESHISRVFRDPQRCRIKTVQAIADALGVDLSDLLRDATRTG